MYRCLVKGKSGEARSGTESERARRRRRREREGDKGFHKRFAGAHAWVRELLPWPSPSCMSRQCATTRSAPLIFGPARPPPPPLPRLGFCFGFGGFGGAVVPSTRRRVTSPRPSQSSLTRPTSPGSMSASQPRGKVPSPPSLPPPPSPPPAAARWLAGRGGAAAAPLGPPARAEALEAAAPAVAPAAFVAAAPLAAAFEAAAAAAWTACSMGPSAPSEGLRADLSACGEQPERRTDPLGSSTTPSPAEVRPMSSLSCGEKVSKGGITTEEEGKGAERTIRVGE